MGYQAESGPWRSIYLQGALELRKGVPSSGGTNTASPDTIRAMEPELLFNYWGVRLNAEKAAGKKGTIVFAFTDLKKQYALRLENSTLTASERIPRDADATVTLSKAALDKLSLGQSTADQSIQSGEWKVAGKTELVTSFFGMLDDFPFWFNIVTP